MSSGNQGKRSCILEFDGASSGNPGKSGAGAVLPDGNQIEMIHSAALTLQRIARGFIEREQLNKILKMKRELDDLEKKMEKKIEEDKKERIGTGESITKLLLKLDSADALQHFGLISSRKLLVKRANFLLDRIQMLDRAEESEMKSMIAVLQKLSLNVENLINQGGDHKEEIEPSCTIAFKGIYVGVIALGVVLYSSNKGKFWHCRKIIQKEGPSLGHCQKRIADYHALIFGMSRAIAKGFETVIAIGDNKSLRDQVEKPWMIGSSSREEHLCLEVWKLKKNFKKFSIMVVDKEENAAAHSNADKALKTLRVGQEDKLVKE